jgi:glutathione S-transferase
MLKATKRQLDVLGSVAASTLALWRGTSIAQVARQPAKPLKLYDLEGSPQCRVVREALTALGLDAQIYPCPKGGKRFSPEVQKLGGKPLYPLLLDANTGRQLHEAGDIVAYLFQTYGNGKVPAGYQPNAVTLGASQLGSLARGLRGVRARPSKPPKKLLDLWSFESSPYSRLVRERLTELELPYTLHNLGKEQWADMGPAVMRVKPGPYRPKPGGKREQLLKTLGRVQVPYLEDSNTGAKLFESAAIIDYLEQRYAA